MPTDLPLRCSCGTVRGVARNVSPDTGNHLVCMCDDCQAYAHWLGRPHDILDESGGTEVFQLTPAQVSLTEGREQVSCMRLSPGGLMRWHTTCCMSPLANTVASPKVPFLGLVHSFIDLGPDERDDALGPVLVRAHGRFGKPPLPPKSHARAPLWLIARALRLLAKSWLRGAHSPSPVFDASGRPIVEPTIISLEERARVTREATTSSPRPA